MNHRTLRYEFLELRQQLSSWGFDFLVTLEGDTEIIDLTPFLASEQESPDDSRTTTAYSALTQEQPIAAEKRSRDGVDGRLPRAHFTSMGQGLAGSRHLLLPHLSTSARFSWLIQR